MKIQQIGVSGSQNSGNRHSESDQHLIGLGLDLTDNEDSNAIPGSCRDAVTSRPRMRGQLMISYILVYRGEKTKRAEGIVKEI